MKVFVQQKYTFNNIVKSLHLCFHNLMRNILIIGAGRSASSLIRYLLDKAVNENLHITIGDFSAELAERKIDGHPNATAIELNIFNESARRAEIQKADIVISMLPAHLSHRSRKRLHHV